MDLYTFQAAFEDEHAVLTAPLHLDGRHGAHHSEAHLTSDLRLGMRWGRKPEPRPAPSWADGLDERVLALTLDGRVIQEHRYVVYDNGLRVAPYPNDDRALLVYRDRNRLFRTFERASGYILDYEGLNLRVV